MCVATQSDIPGLVTSGNRLGGSSPSSLIGTVIKYALLQTKWHLLHASVSRKFGVIGCPIIRETKPWQYHAKDSRRSMPTIYPSNALRRYGDSHVEPNGNLVRVRFTICNNRRSWRKKSARTRLVGNWGYDDDLCWLQIKATINSGTIDATPSRPILELDDSK
jgi:hypothetical protein